MDSSLQVLLRSLIDPRKDPNQNFSQSKLPWPSGTRINGEVLAKLSADIYSVILKGKKITLQSNQKLWPGQSITVEIEKNQKDQAIARIIPQQAPPNLYSAVRKELSSSIDKIGLRNSVENRLIFNTLTKYQLELTDENFRQVRQGMNLLGYNNSASAQIVAFAIKVGLPVQKDLLLLLQQAFSSEELFKSLQTWIAQTKDLIKQNKSYLLEQEERVNITSRQNRGDQVYNKDQSRLNNISMLLTIQDSVEKLEKRLLQLCLQSYDKDNAVKEKIATIMEAQFIRPESLKPIEGRALFSRRERLLSLINDTLNELESLERKGGELAKGKNSPWMQVFSRGVALEELWAGRQILQLYDKSTGQNNDSYLFFIPFQQAEGQEGMAQLKVYKEAGKRLVNPKNMRLLFLLEMKHIGTLCMELEIKEQSVYGRATVQQKEIAILAEALWPQLQATFAAMNYTLHTFDWVVGNPAEIEPLEEPSARKERRDLDLFI
ncbi:hypothetical protein [Heliorestis convoluta]|uniref:Flagellar hook-length control protein FliK n=1 Tax=Heliorestis convoluta TaxID=356322 RepID=A0A5Q2N1A6_9FIRM|nr:hypothetical protein [Heliorestis convoluta]QGG48141.1 hypothetical protein FTV88_2043 [Heliorestis convoluta]